MRIFKWLSFLLLVISGSPLRAVSISVTGPDDGIAFLVPENALATMWTFSAEHIGVGVHPMIVGGLPANPGIPFIGTGFLTTQIGPGTTTADEIARQTFMVFGDSMTPVTVDLFGNLTLPAGTYYFTLVGIDGGWQGTRTPEVVSDDPFASILSTGVYYSPSFQAPYPPASFGPNLAVPVMEVSISAASVVPEPTSTLLYAIGMAALFVHAKRVCKGGP